MATLIRASSMDSSVQNRGDIVGRGSDEEEPLLLSPSHRTSINSERMAIAQRKRRKKNRDMTIPFMILLSMDFMIILLLWIVYEAQPDSNNNDKEYYENDVEADSVHIKLNDGIVVIKNITLTQLLASINRTTTEVQPSTNLQRSSSDLSDGISFNFENRLFDLLFLSAVRGLLLIVAYGLIRLITRSVIIVTTIVSSVMVLIKAAEFDYRRESDCDCLVYILIFFILTLSFAFPWLEFFFLEFNYLPKEIGKYANVNWCSWQAWLWPRSFPLAVNGVTFDDSSFASRQQQQQQRYGTVASMATSLFVTPTASPPYTPRAHIESIAEEPEPLSALDQSYIQQGLESLVITEDLLSSMDGWKLEKTEGKVTCYSRSIGGKKKWRSESVISCNIQSLWKVLYHQLEQQPKWNPQVAVTRSFYRIDDSTDLTYVVSTEAGGGLITSRDFVTVRYWEYKNGIYYSVGKAVTHDSMPSQSGKIRGENGPGGYKLIPEDDNHTRFIWLCDTDLKGWLPQYLIDQTIASMAIQVHQRLARHMDSITQDDDLPLAVS